jgi:hypothetical protein
MDDDRQPTTRPAPRRWVRPAAVALAVLGPVGWGGAALGAGPAAADGTTTTSPWAPASGSPSTPGGTPVVAPSVAVSPTDGPAGTPVSASGAGFAPGETVTVKYLTGLSRAPAATLCTATVGSDGTYRCDGTVPLAAGSRGPHPVKAKGATSGRRATTTYVRGKDPDIVSVAFSGSTAQPTVVVTGRHFGLAPVGLDDGVNSCGVFSADGDTYGEGFYFADVGHFVAGQGAPPNGSCVGLVLQSWTPTQIVFGFGDAYQPTGPWHLSAGDSYQLRLDTIEAEGTVSFG